MCFTAGYIHKCVCLIADLTWQSGCAGVEWAF